MRRWIGLVLLLFVGQACVEDSEPTTGSNDNFDRGAMLTFWADEIIIPAYQEYVSSLKELDSLAQDFVQSPNASKLALLRLQFNEAYIDWQAASIFEIGPAESRSLRNFSNIYPCDTSEVLSAIQDGNYNLTLPSSFDSQGLAAMDYLLFGKASDAEIISAFSEANYATYFTDLCRRLLLLADGTLQEWQASYRNIFINQDGSSADASVNKLSNDYIYHVERELRAGKVGIPAGVFSGSKLPNRVEGFYQGDQSRALFLASLAAHQRFFAGISHDSTNAGPSLKAYLDYLKIESSGTLLSDRILNQYDIAEQKALSLNANLAFAADQQTQEMLQLFDALQQNVVWLKVDMMQALNIRIDYVDADGD